MKDVMLRAFALTAALCIAGCAARAASGAAPADAYFGPLKMTPLQIRLKIDLLGRAYRERWTSDHDILHDAVLAESALRAWRQAYAGDPWLAPTALHLEQLYAAVQLPEARKHAVAMLRYIALHWPATKYGHDARLRVAHGFPPLHAESPVRPTPNAYARTPLVTPSAVVPAPTPQPALTPSSPASTPTRPVGTPPST